MKRLKPEDTARLMPEINGQAKDVVEFLRRTGARVSEALLVRRRHVDALGSVEIPTLKRKKKRVVRTVPISVEYAELLLSRCPDREEPIFTISRQRVWSAMRRAAVRVGVDRARSHPHALRHAFAIANAEKGVPVPVLRKWLGHASLASTLVYVDEIEASRWTPETV